MTVKSRIHSFSSKFCLQYEYSFGQPSPDYIVDSYICFMAELFRSIMFSFTRVLTLWWQWKLTLMIDDIICRTTDSGNVINWDKTVTKIDIWIKLNMGTMLERRTQMKTKIKLSMGKPLVLCIWQTGFSRSEAREEHWSIYASGFYCQLLFDSSNAILIDIGHICYKIMFIYLNYIVDICACFPMVCTAVSCWL